MKSLQKIVSESLLKESDSELTVFFDHEDPNTITFVKDLDKKLIRNLEGGYEVFTERVRTNNILFCMHNDESFIMYDTGCNNINQIKTNMVKDVKNELKQMKKEGEIWSDIEYETLGSHMFGSSILDEIEDINDADPQKIVDNLFEELENSEVDGDSAYAYYFVNVDKEERVGGSEQVNVGFYTSDDVKEMFSK